MTTTTRRRVPETEEAFQNAVVQLAQTRGWRVAHFRRATVRDGRTATPVAYDAAGFPDLVLAHPTHGILFREVKTDTGRVQPGQRHWLDVLAAGGGDVGVWRPRDWPAIEDQLRGRP